MQIVHVSKVKTRSRRRTRTTRPWSMAIRAGTLKTCHRLFTLTGMVSAARALRIYTHTATEVGDWLGRVMILGGRAARADARCRRPCHQHHHLHHHFHCHRQFLRLLLLCHLPHPMIIGMSSAHHAQPIFTNIARGEASLPVPGSTSGEVAARATASFRRPPRRRHLQRHHRQQLLIQRC